MVNSSFHTENLSGVISMVVVSQFLREPYCWTYLGRHDMMYWPYLCNASPCAAYLSAGLTMGAVSLPGESLGANCASVSYFRASSPPIECIPSCSGCRKRL
jgi:hypothetical protein